MSGAGHVDPSNKKVALLIAVLAAFLAFSETLGSSAQTEALSRNIEASNLWSFFQAKTIRMTTLRTAAESLEVDAANAATPEAKAVIDKRVASWKKTAERYDSEPETNEGRKELSARAKASEQKRDRALAAYHQYEVASGALQIAIVLASANVITGAAFLMWGAAGLGVVGIIFTLIGFFAPTAVHLF
jgi:CCR4-NOT transcriptional regulation complex NOT5 subunit